MNQIPRAIVRRVNRVRDRISPTDEFAAEIMDDIFVLCRAFEATWSGDGTERSQSEIAVADTVAAHGIQKLPAVREFIDALRAFEGSSPMQCEEWFGSQQRSASDVRTELLSMIRTLRNAIRFGRWTEHDGRNLGCLIYRMRCAVIHPNLDTGNSLAEPLLPRLRSALIELAIARSAQRFELPLDEARNQFA